MFSLIISIISIALVAALAAATVYFGGAAFNKGAAGADASAFINAGQQIAGAFTLASADSVAVTSVDSLNPDYLAQIPTYKGTSLVLAANDSGTADVDESEYVTVTARITADICTEINKRANGETSPGVVAAVTAIDGLYGCVTATNNAFYKVK